MGPGSSDAVYRVNLFASTLQEVLDAHDGPLGNWDTLTIDQVLSEMMRRTHGRLCPKWTRAELERIDV